MAENATSLIELTANLVAAYVANNPVPPADVPRLIESVNAALAGLGTPRKEPEPELVPAVPIKKSITPDYIISLEDGRKFKSMRRYLGLLGMTPAEYRARWGLPADYPMVAPNYAATRSELAKTSGLGRKKAAEPASEPTPAPTRHPRRRSAAEQPRRSPRLICRWINCNGRERGKLETRTPDRNGYNKFGRTFAAQVDTLKRHRSTGEQKVTVQHVNVSDCGRQALGSGPINLV